jgi:predicted amidohydrolase YtcJ
MVGQARVHRTRRWNHARADTKSERNGVIVVENPTHLASRELFVKRFGVERADQMQPMRSLLDAGIPLALGTDGPNNPYLNIMLATIYPGKPREAITREQAFIAYTLTAA